MKANKINYFKDVLKRQRRFALPLYPLFDGAKNH